MEISYSGSIIELKKELTNLDRFVIGFTSLLNKLNSKYVIVSGYVAILFGRNRREVTLNSHRLFISPLELQIAFKLYLGSEKDIEDARFLYSLFIDKLDSAFGVNPCKFTVS